MRNLSKKANSRKLFKVWQLSEIDKLAFVVFIVKPEIQNDVKMRVSVLGGRVLSAVDATGVPRKPLLQVLGFVSVDSFVIFCIARKEDASNLIEAISAEFNLTKPGNGKAFVVDIDGYLGGKGPLCEV